MIKRVQRNYYTHKSNIDELYSALTEGQSIYLKRAIKQINDNNIEYTIIKYNLANDSISFIYSEDWDTANEPTVGDSVCIKIDGIMKRIKGGSNIYHNKWQFCADDYNGFNIEEAKNRTKIWNSIPNINDKKKYIGNKKYWEALLKENNIPI